MREILDRLREAMTILDNQCVEEHYRDPRAGISATMQCLWRAKYSLWRTQVHILDAAAGEPEPTIY